MAYPFDDNAAMGDKANLATLPIGADPTKWVTKDDWNKLKDRVEALGTALQAGLFHGLASGAGAGLAPVGQMRFRLNPAPLRPEISVSGGAYAPLGLGTAASVASVAALRLRTGSSGDIVTLSGYATPGDGGGGNFFWDGANTDDETIGTIIKVTAVATGRWVRLYFGAVDVRWFGAAVDNTTDDTGPLAAAALVAATERNADGRVFIPAGTLLIRAQLALGQRVKLCGAGVDVTFIRVQINSTTDGITWAAPAQYYQGGGLEDITVWASNFSHVRDLVAVISWEQWNSRNARIQGAGRYALRISDAINMTLLAVTCSDNQYGALWLGDEIFYTGTANGFNPSGFQCTIDVGSTPTTNAWVGKYISLKGEASPYKIVANTATRPTTLTFDPDGASISAPSQTFLHNDLGAGAGSTAYIVQGSISTTVQFFGCYFNATNRGVATDVDGIGILFSGCTWDGNGAGDPPNSPAMRVRGGVITLDGPYFEANRGTDMILGTYRFATVSISNPTIVAPGARGVIELDQFTRGGGCLGGDFRRKNPWLVIRPGAALFTTQGIFAGSDPQYDPDGVNDINLYPGVIQYSDAVSGDIRVTGDLQIILKGLILRAQKLGINTLNPQRELDVRTIADNGGVMVRGPTGQPNGTAALLIMGMMDAANGGLACVKRPTVIGGETSTHMLAGVDTTGGTKLINAWPNHDAELGDGEALPLAPGSTEGWSFIRACAGVPTGVPARAPQGTRAITTFNGVVYTYLPGTGWMPQS